MAEYVFLPLLKAHGFVRYIILVVEALGHPYVGDGQHHGAVRARPRSQPLAAQPGRRVVAIGIDMDAGNAQFLQPLAANRSLVRPVDSAGRLRIARPEDDHLGVLHAVFHGAVGLAPAIVRAIAPVMRRAPVPAFPAIRVMRHRSAADHIEEPVARALPIAQYAPGVMRSAAVQDRPRPMLALHALNLRDDDVQRLIPADALVARDAPVLRIAFPVRVKVHPLHGIEQPILGVNHRLPGQSMVVDRGLARRRKALAAGLDRP